MPLARSFSVALVGVQGQVVEVEADLGQGLPGLVMVGLPDTALAEARDRVRAAVLNSGLTWPQRRITIGLSPASLPKRGSGFDLALAAAVLAAEGAVPPDALLGRVLVGELGLDGAVRPVRGVLPAALAAADGGFAEIVVPARNRREAAMHGRVRARGVRTLLGLVMLLGGQEHDEDDPADVAADAARPAGLDLADVAGQPIGRTALEVAAAGGHHLLLLGPPGSGKTMLAERLPGVLPPLDRDAQLAVTAVHSVAGTLPAAAPLVTVPPFQAPHHTATRTALVGGGSGVARPGAASLAHRGVLFLDEAPEFSRAALDALRQPLESGVLVLDRVGGTAVYPARFQLVLAANPCPCAQEATACSCAPSARRRYLARLSGPLLDRVDLHLTLPRITRAELLADRGSGETSAAVAARVAAARDRALRRYAGTPWRTNAEVPGPQLKHRWPLQPRDVAGALAHVDSGRLTARGFDKVLRTAWTLADLQGLDRPTSAQVDHALMFRGLAAGLGRWAA